VAVALAVVFVGVLAQFQINTSQTTYINFGGMAAGISTTITTVGSNYHVDLVEMGMMNILASNMLLIGGYAKMDINANSLLSGGTSGGGLGDLTGNLTFYSVAWGTLLEWQDAPGGTAGHYDHGVDIIVAVDTPTGWTIVSAKADPTDSTKSIVESTSVGTTNVMNVKCSGNLKDDKTMKCSITLSNMVYTTGTSFGLLNAFTSASITFAADLTKKLNNALNSATIDLNGATYSWVPTVTLNNNAKSANVVAVPISYTAPGFKCATSVLCSYYAGSSKRDGSTHTWGETFDEAIRTEVNRRRGTAGSGSSSDTGAGADFGVASQTTLSFYTFDQAGKFTQLYWDPELEVGTPPVSNNLAIGLGIGLTVAILAIGAAIGGGIYYHKKKQGAGAKV